MVRDPDKLASTVQGLIQDGTLTQSQGDQIISTDSGSINALADQLLSLGTINQAQRDTLVSQGGWKPRLSNGFNKK